MAHPLMGADLGTLARLAASHWPPPRRALGRLALAGLAALGRAPFTALEQGYVAWRRPARTPRPVFIVGHWRSGTTHLYNLMSRDPRFGFVSPIATGLPWEFLTLGRALRPLLERALPKSRVIDRVAVRPDSPQEDEIALASMQRLSFYHGLYFPSQLRAEFDRGVFFDGVSEAEIRRWARRLQLLIKKLMLAQPGRELLIKNPVYTARVARLARLYPEARFIHIRRNPFEVFQSTRNFYRRLTPALAVEPVVMDPAEIDRLILETFPRLMHTVEAELGALPPGRWSATSFEALERAPLDELARIYGELALPPFEPARAPIQAYLDGLGRYERNAYGYPEADNRRVAEAWAAFIEPYGYQPPLAAAPGPG